MPDPSWSWRLMVHAMDLDADGHDESAISDHGDLTGLGDFDHDQYARAAYGGREVFQAHGATGSTETIDLANGNYHAATLDADCTFTFTGSAAGRLSSFTLELLEDGTGGWDPTWPASVVWIGDTPVHDTTAGTTTFYVFHTRDNGTTWFGAQIGGGSGVGSAEDISALGFVGQILISDSPSTPLVFADLIQNEAQNDLVYADL